MNLQKSITDFVEKIDDKQRYYIFAGLLLAVFLMDYLLLMRPQLAALAKITPETKILADDLSRTRANIKKIDRYRQQVDELQEKIEQTNLNIITRLQLPLVTRSLYTLAEKHNIDMDQVIQNPGEESEVLKVKDRVYYAWPFRMRVRSGYHDLGRFLHDLEYNTDYLLDVQTLSIVTGADPKTHQVELVLNVLYYEPI
jgi:Tfp pilus assembly protein PilO